MFDESVRAPDDCESIEEVRHAIDQIDQQIINSLGQRFLYVKTITRFKKSEEDVKAPERYKAVLATRRHWAEENGLDPEMIETLYRNLIEHFIAIELEDLGGNNAARR